MNDYWTGYWQGVAAADTRDSWTSFLLSAAPDTFFTVTFRSKLYHPRAAMDKVIPALRENFSLAFLGAEQFYLGGYHLHGVAKAKWIDTDPAVARASFAHRAKTWGLYRVEPIIRHNQVSAYVTKYITKSLADYELVGDGWHQLTQCAILNDISGSNGSELGGG